MATRPVGHMEVLEVFWMPSEAGRPRPRHLFTPSFQAPKKPQSSVPDIGLQTPLPKHLSGTGRVTDTDGSFGFLRFVFVFICLNSSNPMDHLTRQLRVHPPCSATRASAWPLAPSAPPTRLARTPQTGVGPSASRRWHHTTPHWDSSGRGRIARVSEAFWFNAFLGGMA